MVNTFFAPGILAMASGYVSTQAVLDNSDDDNDYNESMIEDNNSIYNSSDCEGDCEEDSDIDETRAKKIVLNGKKIKKGKYSLLIK